MLGNTCFFHEYTLYKGKTCSYAEITLAFFNINLVQKLRNIFRFCQKQQTKPGLLHIFPHSAHPSFFFLFFFFHNGNFSSSLFICTQHRMLLRTIDISGSSLTLCPHVQLFYSVVYCHSGTCPSNNCMWKLPTVVSYDFTCSY